MLFFRFNELNLSVCNNNEIKTFQSYLDFVDFIKDYTKVLPIKLSSYSNSFDSLTKWKYTICVSILDYKTKRFKIIGFLYDDSCKSCYRFFNSHYLDCFVEAYTLTKAEDFYYHLIC
ncbi:MAG: hypothetical protein E7183_07770 [Erysipelotrichaceae bacterium]|nr:hypothetical protein [Erysipelotrichaceae bacterium]